MTENQRIWAEIDLDTIENNTKIVRGIVPKSARLMAVVKADGYGHGALECAKMALYGGAEYLGVAIAEEGVWLRENNIMEPILVLGYTPGLKITDVLRHNLTQRVFHIQMARDLSEAALKLNKRAKIHIKIDTGMGRLGFFPDEKSIGEILEIYSLPGIEVEGIYTHLADVDRLESAFSFLQYEKFKGFLSELNKRGLSGIVRHICNSAGICRFGHMSMDMARSGILLYGLTPSPEIDISAMGLLPAMSVKSRISYIKELEPGVSVGYGRSFFTERKTVVATVPAGYADGFSRRLSNRGKVLVDGCFAPIIGNICMDQFMIDVTDIAQAKENSLVTLLGTDGDLTVSADSIAETEGVINYEIVCNIGKRVPRAYIRNSEFIKLARL